MTDQFTVSTADPGDISENDILFECGNCGKSLVIDRRGAGLTINCPDCDTELQVPIPEGVDLDEIDQSISAAESDDLEYVGDALDLSALPEALQTQVQDLVTEVQELRFRRRNADQREERQAQVLQTVSEQVGLIREALDKLAAVLAGLDEKTADDTQSV
ncbi:MAG: hypothetical protein ABR497_11185 [Kiritimatiellia bacterium]|nr:hypothetical protein [Lentisphaerota bacterium]